MITQTPAEERCESHSVQHCLSLVSIQPYGAVRRPQTLPPACRNHLNLNGNHFSRYRRQLRYRNDLEICNHFNLSRSLRQRTVLQAPWLRTRFRRLHLNRSTEVPGAWQMAEDGRQQHYSTLRLYGNQALHMLSDLTTRPSQRKFSHFHSVQHCLHSHRVALSPLAADCASTWEMLPQTSSRFLADLVQPLCTQTGLVLFG